MSKSGPEVVVVGGGIMGTSVALALAREGAKVTVLERAILGAEASTAAAGIIGPEIENEEPGAMRDLCRKSRALYPSWVRALQEDSNIPIGFLEGGSLLAFEDPESLRRAARARKAQVEEGSARVLRPGKLRALEPELDRSLAGALYFPSDRRLTPSSLFRATHVAAAHAGVKFITGALVREVLVEGAPPRARGILLDDGTELRSDVTVIAAGSWTTLVRGLPLRKTSIIPARGQLLSVRTPLPVLGRLVFGDGTYLIPRADGELLIGSTLEFVGYQKGVSAGGAARLLSTAVRLVPALADALLQAHWSNFRPYTPDHLPLLGALKIKGLIVASGHYRNGILLAPITAQVVTRLAFGRRPPLPLGPFDPLRPPLEATHEDPRPHL